MDKHSLEQQFCKSVAVAFLCEKTRAVALVQLGLMVGKQAGRLADEMVRHLEIFRIIYWTKH